MARQTSAVEINKFNAGLNTDSSPLTTPDNTSLDEQNFVLNSDGSRNRRSGMDFEENYSILPTSVVLDSSNVAYTTFKWENAGGDASRNVLVVQLGNQLDFFNLTTLPISTKKFSTLTYPSVDNNTKFAFACVDGRLIVTTGEKQPYVYALTSNTLTQTRVTLKVRDLFGVEDIFQGRNLYEGINISERPTSSTSAHIYNLRNQTWGVSRLRGGPDTIEIIDPISTFRSVSGNLFPSNSDNVLLGLYPDAEANTDRLSNRFFPRDVFANPIGTTKAPLGYFIIDALDRGASRRANEDRNAILYPELNWRVSSLPTDRTPGGPKVVSEYAGRAWFSGFSGELVGGDLNSPRLSSYVMFSTLVRSLYDIANCYQEGDPTSSEAPDIIDTDGGFIRINEAYNIVDLVNLGDSLIIIAANGIWRITGSNENGFTATSFIVEKISKKGCTNPDSIIVVDNSLFYWSDDGIYNLTTDQFGEWISTSITENRIQRLFDTISSASKARVNGAYDSYSKKVKWLYNTNINEESVNTKELILDLVLTAFYINDIKPVAAGFPKVITIFNSNPYSLNSVNNTVLVDTDVVMVDTDEVSVDYTDLVDIDRGEIGYITVVNNGGTVGYSFSNYTNDNFIEWQTLNGIGVDAEAYMITSFLSGTDFQRNKSVPYLTAHLRRTETGIDVNGNAVGSSSCILQVRWNWSNTSNSNEWSRPIQLYRYRSRPLYLPSALPDSYDNGFSTIVTRNKIRGHGKVVNFKFSSEPGKNLHLYGWSMIFSVAENV